MNKAKQPTQSKYQKKRMKRVQLARKLGVSPNTPMPRLLLMAELAQIELENKE